MAIEQTIIAEVKTLLNTISTANGYNLNFACVDTRDEFVHIRDLDAAGLLPAALIRYGDIGHIQDQFRDVPRLGRVNEMLPILVRVVVKDTGGDTITTLAAKAHEDIKRAIGDNIRQNVASVYRAVIREPRKPRDVGSTWGTPYEVLDFPIEVWHDWEQRELVTPTPVGLQAPTAITFTPGGGQVKIVFSYAAPAVSVNIYKDDAIAKSAYTQGEWTDIHWYSDAKYRLESVDASGNTASTPVFGFPYYPTASPEVDYLVPSWQLAEIAVATSPLGAASPEMLIESRIRKLIELGRIDNGVFAGVLTSSCAGPLMRFYLQSARLPTAHIEITATQPSFVNTSETRNRVECRIQIIADADITANDPTSERLAAHQITHELRELLTVQQNLGGLTWVEKLDLGQITWPQDAIEMANRLVFRGEVRFTVQYKTPWRA